MGTVFLYLPEEYDLKNLCCSDNNDISDDNFKNCDNDKIQIENNSKQTDKNPIETGIEIKTETESTFLSKLNHSWQILTL